MKKIKFMYLSLCRTKMNVMGRMLFILIFLVLHGCTSYPPEITESLVLAGENRKELIRVLEHYQKDEDSLKYKAACFLIENMRWHRSSKRVERMDEKIPEIWKKMNHLYNKIVTDFPDGTLEKKMIQNQFWNYAEVMNELIKLTPIDTSVTVRSGVFEDLQMIGSDFLIGHIDHTFDVWRTSKFARHLSFEEFCEYILPYRSVNGSDFFYSGKWLHEKLGSYVSRSSVGDFRGYLKRYCHYVQNVSLFSREIQLNESTGIYDLFFSNIFDCVTISNNACNVFRACGLPMVVDYMMTFKEYPGRHFYCNFIDSVGVWHRFNPQSTYLDTVSPIKHVSVNFYRNTFAAQKDSPYFLKEKGEMLPGEFTSPCMKDVTRELHETVEYTMPFERATSHRLAYLYAFSASYPGGIVPVTWGEIDKKHGQVTFKNAMYDVLYFPMFIDEGKACAFAEPFLLVKDSLSGGFTREGLVDGDTSVCAWTIVLHRKFPYKGHLLEIIGQMTGGRFEGANKPGFSDAKVLYTIKEVPLPYFQEYVLENDEAYRYYRYVAPERYLESQIAELEFLTTDREGKHTCVATPLPVFCEEDIEKIGTDEYVQVLTEDTTSMYSYSFFDKNALTYSFGRYNEIGLPKPVVVQRVRMLPRTADNMIRPGDRYLLSYWDGEWRKFGVQKAEYHFLKFENVPKNRVYWLKNLDRGEEEMPFVYRDGKQVFVYGAVVRS